MKNLLMAILVVGFAGVVKADVQQPLWDCALSFDVKGGGLQVFVGKYQLQGKGQLSCVDVAGNTQIIPLKVTIGSEVAAQVAFGRARMMGVATGIGVSTNPEALLGTYVTAGASAALGVGAGASLSLHGSQNAALTINANVSLLEGVGMAVGVSKVKLERAN
jgi:hypothetical protein